MKKLKVIKPLIIALLLGSFLFSAEFAYSSGIIKVRNKCRWYSKKYKVKSRVWFPGWWNTKGKSHCTYAYKYNSVFCAGQATWAGNSGFGQAGWTTSWICGRGAERSTPNLFNYSNNLLQPLEVRKKPDAKTTEISSIVGNHFYDTKSHKVILSNMRGFFSTPNDDSFTSEFEIIVWHAKDDTINGIEDTLMCDEKILWSAKAVLKNGQLLIEGGFDAKDFTFSASGGIAKVELNNITKEIPINSTISLDEVAIYIRTHGLGKRASEFDKLIIQTKDFLDKNSSNTAFTTTLNPQMQLLDIAFTLPNNESVVLKVLDQNGELSETVFTGNVVAGVQQRFQVDDLPFKNSETLFVLLEINTAAGVLKRKLLKLESLLFDSDN